MISNSLLRVKYKFNYLLNKKEKDHTNRIILDINDSFRFNWAINGQVNETRAYEIIGDYLGKIKKHKNFGQKGYNTVAHIRKISNVVKQFLVKKDEYVNLLAELWDNYYVAAIVYMQEEEEGETIKIPKKGTKRKAFITRYM